MLDADARAAFERLLKIARSDTGQSRRCANFILAWWNASEQGGFDLADLFSVDDVIAADMATVVACLGKGWCFYPEEYRADIEALIRHWRPENWKRYQADDAVRA